MELDRTTALCYFLRFLAGNPEGDAAARALVLGALSPLGVATATIYAHDRQTQLELVGNYGYPDEVVTGYRSLSINLPLPLCEAFVTMNPLIVNEDELLTRFPILLADASFITGNSLNSGKGTVVATPILNSGVAIGALAIVQPERSQWEPTDWQYLDGVTAGLAMWLNNQREILADRWRRAAPPAQREVRISERQREILEMVGLDHTNSEIAKSLGYSVPTIKKDLQYMMKMLGTHDRRSTAGRAREIGLLPERRRGD